MNANYLLDHIFEKHRIDKNTSKSPKEQWEEFLSNNLSKENYWGGSETITAISELFKVKESFLMNGEKFILATHSMYY